MWEEEEEIEEGLMDARRSCLMEWQQDLHSEVFTVYFFQQRFDRLLEGMLNWLNVHTRHLFNKLGGEIIKIIDN